MDPLPPDPYLALGISKDADVQLIKSTYKKVVLKCHPDKFLDPVVKQQKVDEFHRIQSAYELLSDEQRRQSYHDHLDMEALRRDIQLQKQRSPTYARSSYPSQSTTANSSVHRHQPSAQPPTSSSQHRPQRPSATPNPPPINTRSSSYTAELRTPYGSRSAGAAGAAPAPPSPPTRQYSFSSARSVPTSAARPTAHVDDVADDLERSFDRTSSYMSSRRKSDMHSTSVHQSKHSSRDARDPRDSRDARDAAKLQSAKVSERSRSEKKKKEQTKAEKRDRKSKYMSPTLEDEYDDDYSSSRHHRHQDRHQDREYPSHYRSSSGDVPKSSGYFSSEKDHKYQSDMTDARQYIDSTREKDSGHPHLSRSYTSHPQYVQVRRPSADVRRSSARPSLTRHASTSAGSSRRHHRSSDYPHIVDPPPPEALRRPSMPHSSESTPAGSWSFPEARGASSSSRRSGDPTIPRTIRRSETEPINLSSSSEAIKMSGSKLRHVESVLSDSGYSSTDSPANNSPPNPNTTTRYYYGPGSASAGGVSLPQAAQKQSQQQQPQSHHDAYHTVLVTPSGGSRSHQDQSTADGPPIYAAAAARRAFQHVDPATFADPASSRRSSAPLSFKTGRGLDDRRSSNDDRSPLFGEVVNGGVSYSKRPQWKDVNWASPEAAERRRAYDTSAISGWDSHRPNLRRGETTV